MTKWQRMVKKTINDMTKIGAHKVVCHKDGTVSAKYGYFYRHGNTVAKWAVRVVKELAAVDINVELVSAVDEWRAWPKDSCFVVRIAQSICRFCPRCGSDAIWPKIYSELEYPLDVEWTVESLLGEWECECGWTGWNPSIDVLDPTVPFYKVAKREMSQ